MASDDESPDLAKLLRAALRRCRACRGPDRCSACRAALDALAKLPPRLPTPLAPRMTR